MPYNINIFCSYKCVLVLLKNFSCDDEVFSSVVAVLLSCRCSVVVLLLCCCSVAVVLTPRIAVVPL